MTDNPESVPTRMNGEAISSVELDMEPQGTLIRFEWREGPEEDMKMTHHALWFNVPRQGEFVQMGGHFRRVSEVAWNEGGDVVVSL